MCDEGDVVVLVGGAAEPNLCLGYEVQRDVLQPYFEGRLGCFKWTDGQTDLSSSARLRFWAQYR